MLKRLYLRLLIWIRLFQTLNSILHCVFHPGVLNLVYRIETSFSHLWGKSLANQLTNGRNFVGTFDVLYQRFTIVTWKRKGENYEIACPCMHLERPISTQLHHGWGKFWNSRPLHAPRMTNLIPIFTMVEQSFEIPGPCMHLEWLILPSSSPWLKKILKIPCP